MYLEVQKKANAGAEMLGDVAAAHGQPDGVQSSADVLLTASVLSAACDVFINAWVRTYANEFRGLSARYRKEDAKCARLP